MTTSDIMRRLCHSWRTIRPGDYRLWYVSANPRYMDVLRVARGFVGGPWFEVAR